MPQTKNSAKSNNKGRTGALSGTARQQVERFELLVDELSAEMARATVGEIDTEIEKWLQRIVLALEVDRGAVWERGAIDGVLVGTHSWVRPGLPKFPRNTSSTRVSSWAAAQLLAGKLIVYSNPDNFRRRPQTSGVT